MKIEVVHIKHCMSCGAESTFWLCDPCDEKEAIAVDEAIQYA